jgi:hypothetical protein
MLLDMGAANVLVVLNNPSVNSAPQSSGLTLSPTPTSGQIVAVPANLQAAATQGALVAPLAQNQLYDQFRLLAVNSQGSGNQLQIFQQLFFQPAFGFGSGTQPNQPWVLNAYNLGLANQQWSFPSQSDLGFQAPPSWNHPIAHYQPGKDQPEVEEPVKPESLLVHESVNDADTEPLPSPTQQDQTEADSIRPAAEDPLIEGTLRADGSQPDAMILPDSLWLSALAPAPLAALVAGLPGIEAPVDTVGGEQAVSSAE